MKGYYTRKVASKKPQIKYKYYHHGTSRQVTDRKLIDKLNNIKIPATYDDVTVTDKPVNGLEGTGYDGTGRKQYFYSKNHLEEARKEKYSNLIFLGMNLPKINSDIEKLLKKKSPDVDSLSAMALKIMLMCNFRVGSQNNEKKYGTYGLTTLTTEHITFKNDTAIIKFNGKKQQLNECTIKDKAIVNMLKKLVNHNKSTKSKKKYVFSWDGDRASPESLNDFLGGYHPDITTKTWRTWFANIRYISLMRREKENPESKSARKKISNQVVKKVAEELHHTPAICKKNYLMTELTDLYVDNPSRWKLGSKQKPDIFFTNFLKSYYSISKDWIRRRSRSRARSRSRSRKVGGAFTGPSWKPELANHKPGYTGKLALEKQKEGKAVSKSNKKSNKKLKNKNKSKSKSKSRSRSVSYSGSDEYEYDSGSYTEDESEYESEYES
tara:strand:+ start:1925 stop:3238 length:1314 start_codon:yes stop_codon:yes gene_type:complete